jgi:ABC-type transport system involved in Fe-S cluster assembly fused permease/ATPase subunit
MIFAVFLGSTTVYAAGAVHTGRKTVGDFVLINTYLLQVVRPVESLGYAMQFRERPEPQDVKDYAPMRGPVALEFEDVWLSYRPGHAVLKGLSFKIPAGKTLGIVGPSGSGKPTTVGLLVRLFETHRGRILLGGEAR